ncbi:hypothetical protein ACF0H5_004488 [Mactra antiquata]
MYDCIPYRTIGGHSNFRKHKPKKQWWTPELTELWIQLCKAEKLWLSSKSKSHQSSFKSQYIRMRKTFDREVQRCKRSYWYNMQCNLLDECNIDNTKFWRSIGKIGVNQSSRKSIPEEVTLPDGSISTCIDNVLLKWKTDFNSLFKNRTSDNTSMLGDNEILNNILLFDEELSILDIKNAVNRSKRGKACGIDELPIEVLQNDAMIYLRALCLTYVTIMV